MTFDHFFSYSQGKNDCLVGSIGACLQYKWMETVVIPSLILIPIQRGSDHVIPSRNRDDLTVFMLTPPGKEWISQGRPTGDTGKILAKLLHPS